jgi:hypothetical protein
MPSVAPMTAGFKNAPLANLLIVSTIGAASMFSYSAPAGSGGSFNATTSNLTAYAGFDGGLNVSSLTTVGNTLRDMGKSVVLNGSTFRKVQALVPGVPNATGGSNGGVTGVQGTPTGYATFYVQVPGSAASGDQGTNSAVNVARLVRML